MQEGVTNYSAYAARVEKMIAFVRSCFPEAVPKSACPLLLRIE